MSESLTHAVVGWVAPLLRSRPIKVTFEYSPGHKLVLEEDALRMWWQEYIDMFSLMIQFAEARAVQQHAPIYSSDAVHEAFAKADKKSTSDKKED